MILMSSPAVAAVDPLGYACDVCGSADRLGLGTCVVCARPGSDALLFLDPSRADRRVLEAWLVGALGGAVSRREARDAAEGLRPVVSLPAAAAGRAAGTLTLRGVSVIQVSRAKAWTRIPPAFALLASVTAGVGLFVGLTGTPAMLLLAPCFSALLVLATLRQLRRPVWQPDATPVLGLSEATERDVRATLARLPEGRARRRLKDLAALVAALCEDDEMTAGPELADASDELLRLACGAVVDLDRLDRSLAALEGEPVSAVIAEATDIQDVLVSRLEDAFATLVRAQAMNTDSAGELVEAAERLADESIRRTEAWRQVQLLVS